MNYIYTYNPIEQSALTAVSVLRQHLINGEQVLWLLSGGSGLEAAIIASKSKRLKDLDLSKLFITMTDERYGPIGHKDENWQQLLNSGFEMSGANLYRPLTGQDITTTTKVFNEWLETHFKTADYKLGMFGLGIDGHTAGILPHSIATDSIDFASSYTAQDFERITLSFFAIEQLDEAIIQSSGEAKQSIVHQLVYDGFPLKEQPAQILKKIPNTTLYTNIIKETI